MIQSYKEKPIHDCVEKGDGCMEMAEAAVGMPSPDGENIHMEERRKGGSNQLCHMLERDWWYIEGSEVHQRSKSLYSGALIVVILKC